MEANDRIHFLFTRYQQQTISPAEFDELLIWLYGMDEEQAETLAESQKAIWEKAKAGELRAGAVNWEAMKEAILSSGQTVSMEEKKVKRIWWKVAAAAVLILGIGTVYLITNTKK